jgi:hypothetical protein
MVKSQVSPTPTAQASTSTLISLISPMPQRVHSVSSFGDTNASPVPVLTVTAEYHIHVSPVPSDGNCSGTGGHLSPYGRQDTPACDSTQPDTCQPGDLSGKHGAIADVAKEKNFQKMYLDLFVSTDPSSPSFFGNRSVVVHADNGTRLNCGNFTQMLPSDASATGTKSGAEATGSGSPAHSNAATDSVTRLKGCVVFGAGFVALSALLL